MSINESRGWLGVDGINLSKQPQPSGPAQDKPRPARATGQLQWSRGAWTSVVVAFWCWRSLSRPAMPTLGALLGALGVLGGCAAAAAPTNGRGCYGCIGYCTYGDTSCFRNKTYGEAPLELKWLDVDRDIGTQGRGWPSAKMGAEKYTRLPARAEGIVDRTVWNLAQMSAGLKTRFATGAKDVWIHWTLNHDSNGTLGNCCPPPPHSPQRLSSHTASQQVTGYGRRRRTPAWTCTLRTRDWSRTGSLNAGPPHPARHHDSVGDSAAPSNRSMLRVGIILFRRQRPEDARPR